MPTKSVVTKRISDIKDIPTAHGLGYKRVLVGGNDTDTPITQIAYTMLSMGDVVEAHTHPTMDEHFIILSGVCDIICGEDRFLIEGGTYIYVPSGVKHRIEVKESITLITIGVATE